MKQDDWPPLPQLVPGKLDAIRCSPETQTGFAHPGNVPVASTHLSTSFW